MPAVTRVEECTKEETGVGAAIAAGNQAENGIWALFVIAPKNRKTKNIYNKSIETVSKLHQPLKENKKKQTKKNTSPIRFLKTVIKPDSKLEELP